MENTAQKVVTSQTLDTDGKKAGIRLSIVYHPSNTDLYSDDIPDPMVYRPEEITLFGSGTLSWESIEKMFGNGRWYSATPSAVREMALQLALNYTKEHLDTYRDRDPEHLSPSDYNYVVSITLPT